MSAPAEVLSLPPLHPSLVLSAYAAELVSGSKIALFGDATLALTSELVERGAKLVHVFDIDAVRAAEAGARGSRSVVFGTVPRDGKIGSGEVFDLVFVPDLSFTKDPSPLLHMAKRILSPKGAALIASPNPELLGGEGLGYYELYDAVAATFRRVRMVGQAPFVGYVLAELAAAEEPEVSIDTSLAGRPEPEWFIALAGQREVRFEPYAIVELPYERPSEEAEPAYQPFATIPAPPPFALEPSKPALDAARAEAEARAATAVAEKNRALADAAEAAADRDRALAKQEELGEALEKERKRVREAEAAATADRAELAKRAAEAERLRERAQELEEARAEIEANAAEYQAEIAAFETRLREQGRARQDERREARRRASLVEELVSLVEDMHEGAPLLLETAAEVEEVRAERREAVEAEPLPAEPSLAPESAAVPTALAEAEALPAIRKEPEKQPPSETVLADLQSKLDRLAREAARREADLLAASWRIQELEHRLKKKDAGAG